jgi:hypothetical protein
VFFRFAIIVALTGVCGCFATKPIYTRAEYVREGHVYYSCSAPVPAPNIEVRLVDDSGYVVGRATTDQNGHFFISPERGRLLRGDLWL